MTKHFERIGGFVCINNGIIRNCYSDADFRINEISGGFCAQNNRSITDCYSMGKLRMGAKEGYGFCAENHSEIHNCFWIYRKTENSPFENFSDREIAVAECDDQNSIRMFTKSYDDTIWNKSNEFPTLLDNTYKNADARDYSVVEIASAEEFLEFLHAAETDTLSEKTVYRLTADINLKNRTVCPIAVDQNSAFNAHFDGNHHTIRNFRIRAKNLSYASLFGVIGSSGRVYNLSIDCEVASKAPYCAPLCAVNDGVIADCSAVSHVNGKKNIAGLVAINNGIIENSAALGKLHPHTPFPWWIPLIVLIMCFLIVQTGYIITQMHNSTNAFAPVIVDPNATPLPPEENTPTPQTGNTTDSNAGFIMNADIPVKYSDGTAAIGLKCPAWSKKGFVAEAVVAKSDLVKNGSHYRKDAVVYTSGLINPGNGVDIIQFDTLPDGSRLPKGRYTLTVQLTFYNPQTNERSPVDSTAPLDITVQ